jgi:ATP-dependent exoDNAse (exonuclease V) alpha subunit
VRSDRPGRQANDRSDRDREAKTIHRLFEVDPAGGGFRRNENNCFDCDLLVVDEVSMVDVLLMRALLQATADRAALLIVGDIGQQPPVEPGQALSDIIRSGAIPVVRLTEVFRQAASCGGRKPRCRTTRYPTMTRCAVGLGRYSRSPSTLSLRRMVEM